MSAYSDYLDGKAGGWVGGWGEVGYVHGQLEKQRAQQQQAAWAQPAKPKPVAPTFDLFPSAKPNTYSPPVFTGSTPPHGGYSGNASGASYRSGFESFVMEYSDWAFADLESWLDSVMSDRLLATVCTVIGIIFVFIALIFGLTTWSLLGVAVPFVLGGAALPIGYVGLRLAVALATWAAIMACVVGVGYIVFKVVATVVA